MDASNPSFSRTSISPDSYSRLLAHTWYGVAPSFLSCVNSQSMAFFFFFFSLRFQLSIFFVLVLNSAPRWSTIYRLSHSPLVSTERSTQVPVLKYQQEVPLYTYGVQYTERSRICPGGYPPFGRIYYTLLYLTTPNPLGGWSVRLVVYYAVHMGCNDLLVKLHFLTCTAPVANQCRGEPCVAML